MRVAAGSRPRRRRRAAPGEPAGIKGPLPRSPTRALVPLQQPGQRLTHRGRYRIGRRPGVADLVYALLVVVAAGPGAAPAPPHHPGPAGAGVGGGGARRRPPPPPPPPTPPPPPPPAP